MKPILDLYKAITVVSLLLTIWSFYLTRLQVFPPARKKPRLSHPPGWGLRRFAEFCFSKKTFAEVFAPTLCDMQKEHIEALAEGRLWKARMVLVHGYFAFWSAVVAQLPLSFARRIYEVWKTTKIGS